jgi:hypothetical protein
MTIRNTPFNPHTASDELGAAFNETRRAIAREFWPDELVLDEAETRREVARRLDEPQRSSYPSRFGVSAMSARG